MLVQAERRTYSPTILMIHLRLFFVYLCQACCTAFVSVPATARWPPWRSQQPVLRSCTHRAAVATARPPPPSPHRLSARPMRRPSPVGSSSIGGADEGYVAAGAAPEDDPFRPERASVSPMVINAIVSVLFKHVRRCAPRRPLLGRWWLVVAASLSNCCSCAQTIRLLRMFTRVCGSFGVSSWHPRGLCVHA